MYLELNLAPDTGDVPRAEPSSGYLFMYLELNLAPDTGVEREGFVYLGTGY